MICDFAGDRDQLFGMAILPDGEIVVGGHVKPASVLPNTDIAADLAVARFHQAGSSDSTFGLGGPDGRDGIETTDVRTVLGEIPNLVVDEVNDLALQDDDGQKKVVVVGRSGPVGSQTFVVARYTAGGTLDSGFANQGVATALFPGGGESRASAVAVQPADQKIVVAIRSENDPLGDFVLARFAPDGQLDGNFGTGGFVVTDFPDSQLETASDVLVQPDGKIVAGGRAGQGKIIKTYCPNNTLAR
jgi:uncharacterized delta-60 repeat protein